MIKKKDMKKGQPVVVLKDYDYQFDEEYKKAGEVFKISEDVKTHLRIGEKYCVEVEGVRFGQEDYNWLTLDSVLPITTLEAANVVVAIKDFSYAFYEVKKGEVFPIVERDETYNGEPTARIYLNEDSKRFKINGASNYSDCFVYAYDHDYPEEEEEKEATKEDTTKGETKDMTLMNLDNKEVIYIAAPISTEAEVMYVNHLADTLRTIGYEVYSAAEDDEINDKTNNPTAELIYEKDFDAIDKADIVLFIETGKKQVGSHIELGKVLEMIRSGLEVELIAFTNNYRLDKPQVQEGMASESINHLELGGVLVEGTFVHGMTDGVIQHLIKRKWGHY